MSDYSKTRIQLRRGTAAELAAANPTLGVGEPAFETDTNTLKIGDGSTAYSSLSAISGGGGGGSSTFVGLSDTPANFTSAGSKFLKVNSGASALEFVAVSPLENVVEDTNPQLGGELNLNNKDIVIDAKNNDGTQIDAGTPVYIVDYHAGSSKPLIAPADASDSTKMPAIGITNDDIAGSAEGTVGIMGVIDGIDTTSPVSFNLGDVVYVDNGGGLTNVKPTTAAHLIQNLGRVTKVNASNGRILLLGAGRVNDIPNSGTFSGNIEAASFIKNGGTSSQFLKADGSVDSNTYVTSSISNVVEDTSPQLGGDLDTNGNNVTGTGSINISGTITTTGATASIADDRLKILASETVLNEAGASVDFRVEGDTDVNLLFVDASADRVGVGTSSPSSTLHVNGTMTATTVAKTGGASTEFLKADGSVDTNTYLTAVSNIDTTNFNSSNLIAESDSIASNDNDTTIPTSAAVKAYADTKLASDTSSIANSVAVNNVVLISQSNYDALGSYDANTLYFIS